jgi:hypothetical protein
MIASDPQPCMAGAGLAPRRAARWAAVLALAALAACGRGDGAPAGGSRTGAAAGAAGLTGAAGQTGAAGAPLPDACEVMKLADVQAVAPEISGSLSSTLEDAVGRDPGQCAYSLGGMPPRVISLSLRRLPSAELAAAQLRTAEAGLRSLGAGAVVEEVPGLGDGALWVGGQIDQLHVRRGATLLIFTVQLDKEPLRAARALAERALPRLAGPATAPPARPSPPGGGSAPPASGTPGGPAPGGGPS